MKVINQATQLPASQTSRRDSPKLDRIPRAVIGQDDRFPASELKRRDPVKFRHSLAVGRIFHKTQGGGGTAFLVGSGNHVLTNAHVLASGNPKDYRIDFEDAGGRVTRFSGEKLLAFSEHHRNGNPSSDRHTRPNLDFALFTINSSPRDKMEEKYGHLDLDPNGAKQGQKIYIPQFSRVGNQVYKSVVLSDSTKGPGQPSRIDRVEENQSETRLHTAVRYSADTNPGGSGSPVISADSHKVVALHNGSLDETANTAANMSAIWQQIKRFFPDKATTTRPDGQKPVVSKPDQNKEYAIGDRRNNNGTLQELWMNPSGGAKWVDVWQSKHYPVGALVVRDGNAFAYQGPVPQGASPWAPVFDPTQTYRPEEKVYYYGRIVDAKELIRKPRHQHA